jgi:hypothetical protein
MDVDVSSLDMLYLALSVLGYATAATLWTYFFRPVHDVERAISSVQDIEPGEQGWREAPGAR